jgi:hypothetical protein
MAESINRIVPTSVSFDRTAQPEKDGQKKSNAGKRKDLPVGQRPNSGEEPGEEPVKPNQDKGNNLDISA